MNEMQSLTLGVIDDNQSHNENRGSSLDND